MSQEVIQTTPYGKIKSVSITAEMERSYLDYAMSVIVSRALPDVRDGLKPVHRRILFAMKEMGLTHASPYKKAARIVGEVLGKFHPHGDMAVYDALVRLAQDFSMRYQLIDGHGNFGSVDGDSAAAMRYTEARLAKITDELLADLDKNTVNFIANFDGSQQEPTVLPAKLPNLLLMGSDGIAVGMATKIPPHNLGEVVDALTHLITAATVSTHPDFNAQIDLATANPHILTGQLTSETTIEHLLEHIQGPDFPTGAVIYDWPAISQAYLTGRGKIIMRAVAEIKQGNSGRHSIVITELPYQVNKARLVANMAHLIRKKAITGIADLRDESDREGLRVVIDLKREARPKAILNNLYKHTELQTTFPANFVALNAQGVPQTMNLKQILLEFLHHRQLVVVRRSQFELKTARQRSHILEGLLKALDHIDAVIDTIKSSPDQDTAKTNLITKFALTDIQATAILDMQLRRLAALERQKIKDEYDQLQQTVAGLLDLLSHPQKILTVISNELISLKDKYADDRRTKLVKHGLTEFADIDLVPKKPVLITLTRTGYIKSLPIETYRSQRRGGKGVMGMTTKDEDEVSHFTIASTHDTVFFFTDKGRVFALKAYEIPEVSRQAKGQAVINLINIEPKEEIQAILATGSDLNQASSEYIVLATQSGLIKKTKLSAFKNIRSSGIIAIHLTSQDRLIWVKQTEGSHYIMLISRQGKAIRFSEKDVRPSGRNTKGVRGISLKKDDQVIGMVAFPGTPQAAAGRKKAFLHLLAVTEKGLGKRTSVDEFPVHKRGGVGVKVAELTGKTGPVAAAIPVDHTIKQVVITSKKAQVIKLPLKNIKRLHRASQGVILMRFNQKDDSVAAVTTITSTDTEP